MFGMITHQIGTDLDHEVFINTLPDSKFEVVVYSDKPINKFKIKKALGGTCRILSRNWKENGTYINAIEMGDLTNGGLIITIENEAVPEITWTKTDDLVTLIDFAGEPAYLESNEWHKPENPTHLKQKALIKSLLSETDPQVRESLKTEIVNLLSPDDPDFGYFLLNTIIGEAQ